MVEIGEVFNINKEWDFSYYLDMAGQARDAGELQQGIDICEKTMKEARQQNASSWIKRFDELHSKLLDDKLKLDFKKSMKRAREEEKIFQYRTAISHYERAICNKNALFKLGKVDDKVTGQIKKIQKRINDLKKRMDPKEISEMENMPSVPLSMPIELDVPIEQFESEMTESLKKLEEKASLDSYNESLYENELEIEPEMKFSSKKKPQGPPTRTSIKPPQEIPPQEMPLKQEDVKILFTEPKEKPRTRGKKGGIEGEKLEPEVLSKMLKKTMKAMKNRGYYIIPSKLLYLKSVANMIDGVAIKIDEIRDNLDMIHVVPFKVSPLKGKLIVSETEVEYLAVQRSMEKNEDMKKNLVNSLLKGLVKSQDVLFGDLVGEGNFFKFFKDYLKLDIKVEKSRSQKTLFFRAGPLEHKVMINPIIISEGETGFTEKSFLPFAYQRNSNLHLIGRKDIDDFLTFLERKHRIMEEHSKKENPVSIYFDAHEKLMVDASKYSLPFLGLGIAFIFIVASQLPELIRIFIGIGCGALVLYGVMIAYLCARFMKEKQLITAEFNTPHYKRAVKIDNTDLLLINEKLTSDEMDQFIYECFGKSGGFSMLNRLEDERMEEMKARKKAKKKSLVKIVKPKKEKKGDDVIEEGFSERYSSFLND